VTRRVETLVWVGLFAAPCGFIVEHVSGWLLSEADCGVVGRNGGGLDFSTSVAVVTAVAALFAASGIAASLIAYRAVKGTDNDAPPPPGRMWLLSICGIVVSTLLFILIVLGGSGALLLGHCQAS
jgi:hypothetical protein